jgi:hypothetical protein
MAKKDNFIIKKTEILGLNFYAVRSQDGKWLRAKKHGYNSFDTSGSWTENISEAKIYGKPGPAKTQITFWGNNYPKFGIPDLVKITTGECQYLDQEDRVKKAGVTKQKAKLASDLKYAIYYREQHAAKVKLMRGDGKDDQSLRLSNNVKEIQMKIETFNKENMKK